MLANDYNIASNNDLKDKEVFYLDRIDAILGLAVKSVDDKIDEVGYIDEDPDPDYSAHVNEVAEFIYMAMRFWVDIRIENYSCIIDCVDAKDDNDSDYYCLSGLLKVKLEKYYLSDSRNRANLYNQALEIKQDQRDPYNLRPKMPLGYDVNTKYLNSLKSICEDEDHRIKLFLGYGSAGKMLKMKSYVKVRDLVKAVLPIINKCNFVQVNKLSDKTSIARFIQSNFILHNNELLKISTLKNEITRNFRYA